jgi:protein-disulfide isomerase/uncharacterized membrane protein
MEGIMEPSLTLRGWTVPRALSLFAALAMAVVAVLTIEHFFSVRFPTSLDAAAACDATSFFRCGDSALAPVSAPFGVPLGVFGLMVAAAAVLGVLFPSPAFERTNTSISLLNAVLALGLIAYSVIGLRSLCLLCTSYGIFALLNFLLYWEFGLGRDDSFARRYLLPSPKLLATLATITVLAAAAVTHHHGTLRAAQAGQVATGVVSQFFALSPVPEPSVVSPYRVIDSADRFHDAPVRVIEYSDFLCSDCLYLSDQVHRLERDFPGQINWAFQFFPLEAACNDVVEKDKHPGACELAYIAAHQPARFREVHDEIFANYRAARTPEWRADFARRIGAEGAAADPATRALVHTLIRTGTEYERTSEQYSHGIRSTPTLIINGRMIIGTLPYEQLRAIVQAVLDERTGRGRRYLESWVPGE